MKRFINRDKILAVKFAKEHGVQKAAAQFGASTASIFDWIFAYDKGLFKGREHLTTIAYSREKKKNDTYEPAPVKMAQPEPPAKKIGLCQPGSENQLINMLLLENKLLCKALSAFIGEGTHQ